MTTMDALKLIFQDFAGVVRATLTLDAVLWIAVTLAWYFLALKVHRFVKGSPLLHPLVVTASGVGITIALVHGDIRQYQLDAALIHWLLGPATIALALPMYNQWHQVRDLGWRLVAAVGAGGIIAPLLAWSVLYTFDTPLAIQMTMLVKSITTPLAMEAGAKIGGVPALAAVFVIITGIVGAVVSDLVFRLCRVTSPQAQGIAMGTVAHAVGTAKALQMNEHTGAMATLGLCLNGIMTAIVVPLLFG